MATSLYEIGQGGLVGVSGSLPELRRLSDGGLMIARNVHNNSIKMASTNDRMADSIDGPTPCALSFSRGCDDDMHLSVFESKVEKLSVSTDACSWDEYVVQEEEKASFDFRITGSSAPVQMNPPPLRDEHLHVTAFCSSKPLDKIIDAVRETFKGKQYHFEENVFESTFIIAESSDDATCGFQVNLYVDDSVGKSTIQYIIEAQHFSGCTWTFNKAFVTLKEAVEGTATTEIVVLPSTTTTSMMDSVLRDGIMDYEKSRDDHKKESMEALQC